MDLPANLRQLSSMEQLQRYILLLLILARTADNVDMELHGPPTFVLEPQSVIVAVETDAILLCSAEPNDTKVHWLINGASFQSNSNDVNVSDGRLLLNGKSSGTAAVYQCLARNSIGSVLSAEARVERAVLEEFNVDGEVERNISVLVRNTAVIPCKAPYGIPTPLIEYEHNGKRLNLTERHTVISSSGNLHIANASRRDAGVYHCIAYNTLTAETRSSPQTVTLNIIYSANRSIPLMRFTVTPLQQVTVVSGHNVTLECAAEGVFPQPRLIWLRSDDRPLPTERHHQILGNLVIENVEKSDEATYVCVISNYKGSQSATASTFVEVLELPVITDPPLADVKASVGSPVELQCVATGFPAPAISWYHNAQLIRSESTSLLSSNNTVLILTSVDSSHAGVYQCFARNELGSVYRSTLLTVHPVEDSTEELPAEEDEEDEESESFSTELANPIMTVAKFIDTTTMNQKRNDNASLGSVNDEGAIMLHTTSRRSSSRQRTSPVRPISPWSTRSPSTVNNKASLVTTTDLECQQMKKNAHITPPSKPTVTRLTDTSVQLDWTLAHDITNTCLHIVFLKVQYKEKGSAAKRHGWQTIEEELDNVVRSYSVTGLRTGGIFQFRIFAVGSNGDNKQGENSDWFTLEPITTGDKDSPGGSGRVLKPPSSVPVIVEVRYVNNTVLVVVWQALHRIRRNLRQFEAHKERVNGFHVYYRPYTASTAGQLSTSEDMRNYSILVVPGPKSRQTSLVGLLPHTVYSIHMTSFNSDGDSPRSKDVAKETTDPTEQQKVSFIIADVNESLPPTSPTAPRQQRPYVTTTSTSNELLFIVLGCVLGTMLLILIIVMVMCALKQRQRSRMMAAIDGRRKFHDPAQAIYLRRASYAGGDRSSGRFLLSTINGSGRGPGESTPVVLGKVGCVPAVRLSGVGDDSTPCVQTNLSVAAVPNVGPIESEALPMLSREELPDKDGAIPIDCELTQSASTSLQSSLTTPVDGYIAYRPPTNPAHPSSICPPSSAKSSLPTSQKSVRSSRMAGGDRCPSNSGETIRSSPTTHSDLSPDHIPRLHECQQLYRSPEHVRRSHDRSHGRSGGGGGGGGLSELCSISSSTSQLSTTHPLKPNKGSMSQGIPSIASPALSETDIKLVDPKLTTTCMDARQIELMLSETVLPDSSAVTCDIILKESGTAIDINPTVSPAFSSIVQDASITKKTIAAQDDVELNLQYADE